ncbi:O-antigen ligase family protein [uncultured Senegalimassilia sp.]|uniref:O-antigen ligase family protein n=1 Tax=uncultured Senegalimassilia sp. TaxID=1714350 RepID=UPI0027DCE0E5|nr:O-antigen ligase family protein [uncultured Senegalimassilia sp.]
MRKLSCFLPVYLIFLLTVCVVEVVYSMKVMGSPLSASIKASEVAFFVLALPLLIQMIVDGSCRKMLDLLTVIASVCAAAMLLQSFFYSATGGILFSAMTNTSGADVSIRDFGIRFSPPGGLMSFAAIYSVICAVFADTGKHGRLPYLFSALLLVSAIVVVYQTRMEDIALVGSLLLGIVLCAENGKLSKGIKGFLAVLLLVLMFAMGFFESFIETFSSTDSVYSGSASIRTYAYSYYAEMFLKYPLFGFGSLPSASSLLHGNGTAYISDVGVVGLSAQWGILFIALYLVFFWRMVSVYRETRRDVNVLERALMLSIIIYLLFTSATLCCFSPALGIRVVIALALFELVNYQVKEKRKAGSDA